jgi:hypothetical protein
VSQGAGILNGVTAIVPDGTAPLRTTTGPNVQTTHLVRRSENGGTPGDTLCGLTRFDRRDPETWAVIEEADIRGWSVGGGVFGPGVVQQNCAECFAAARPICGDGEAAR